MSRSAIEVKGIETNNLKKIDISIKKGEINLIVGPSGSGKSSLAYDTIAQISRQELESMYSDVMIEPQYKVSSYSNIPVSIPIKQINNNNNVRSTIGTYFSLNSCLAKIFSTILDIPYDFFVLNKSENVCNKCGGLGYVKKLDINKIINYDIPIEDIPIRCWTKNKEFYKKIIKEYCTDCGIDYHKNIRKLTNREKELLLYGISEKKYCIKYKVANCISSRTTQYFGVMTEQPMLKKFAPNPSFFSEVYCDECYGEKFSHSHRDKKICGYSIGELMLLRFDNFGKWILDVKETYGSDNIKFSLDTLYTFASKAVELNLGYLYLNRNIPSLSGGELQRLKLVKVFTTQLNDLLIVLDEPLAGLSLKEYSVVYQNIKELLKKHTLLVIDHHSFFLKDAKNIIALGEKGGIYGGNLIDPDNYLKKESKVFDFTPTVSDEEIEIKIDSNVYNYKGAQLKINLNSMNIVFGSSGVGKSTLIREYLNQFFENYTYINQKPLNGNSYSSVASTLNIQNIIINMYAKYFNKEKSFFSNLPSAKGVCPKCKGTGLLSYGTDYQSKIVLRCDDCDGTGFSNKLTQFKINGMSIIDVWKMNIDDASLFFDDNEKVFSVLTSAQELLLGHLPIGEKTSALSGGENVRIKILKSINDKTKVYGIDEPFRGLNNEEIDKMAHFLSKLVYKDKTVIVVDHDERCFKYFSKCLKLSNVNGTLVGLEEKSF